jgi:hypothetical protein
VTRGEFNQIRCHAVLIPQHIAGIRREKSQTAT